MKFDKIKEKIILKDGIYYFDYTASGLAYKPIEDEIQRVLKTYSNIHSDTSQLAKITNEYYDRAREGLKNLLEVDTNKFYLISCGFGATAAIKKFQEIMGIYLPPKTREILGIDKSTFKNLPLVIISPYEHHSNDISYRAGLCEVVRLPLNEKGLVDFDELDKILITNKGRKIIAAFSVASNVTGIITEYKKLYLKIKLYGGIVALDATACLAYMNVDCAFYDVMFASSHKLLGGVGGSGILVIRKSLCDIDEPTFAGGGTVRYVSRSEVIYHLDKEELEEAGTPGITQLLRAYLAFKLRNDIGLENIRQKEVELSEYLLEKFLNIDDIKLFAKDIPLENKLAILSFNVKGFNPYDFAAYLSQKYFIETRAGCACAGPYTHDLMGKDDGVDYQNGEKPSFIRISLHYTHTKDDIDYLVRAIKEVIKKRGQFKHTNSNWRC
ncbi:MAG: aminotransferase class V-fold PLP-dependent enzyme [Campylobacter sp.]|nr:aminotransferase class V-fold PLP-dependent enzyme [Campylobacter sp.]